MIAIVDKTHQIVFRLLICVFLLVSVSGCTALLFQPVKEHAPLPQVVLEDIQDFYFPSYDGTQLHGWYIPAKKDLNTSLTVLFLHGNAYNMSTHLGGAYWLSELGVDAYLFDYRGYGKSEGIAFLDGIVGDIDAAIKYVSDKIGDDHKLWVIGHSIGASMGIYSLSQSQYKSHVAGMISVSAFSDYREVTREFLSRNWFTWMVKWPLSFAMDNTYRPLDYVSAISPLPVVFVHGLEDDIIDSHHSKALFEAAKPPKELRMFSGKHNDIFLNPEVRNYIFSSMSNVLEESKNN